MEAPICPYCGATAQLVDSAVIYRGSFGNAWVCARYPACDAYVGVHQATDEPLGRLANAELRDAKKSAHAAFDPLWKEAPDAYAVVDKQSARRIRQKARSRAYAWLAEQLGLDPDACHIGEFDVDQCKRVVAVCPRIDAVAIRVWAKQRETTQPSEGRQ